MGPIAYKRCGIGFFIKLSFGKVRSFFNTLLINQVLEPAFAAFVTLRTIEGMVGQDDFQKLLTHRFNSFRIRIDGYARKS